MGHAEQKGLSTKGGRARWRAAETRTMTRAREKDRGLVAAVEVGGRKDRQIMGLAAAPDLGLGAHLLKIISRDDGPSSITLRNEKPSRH